MTRSEPTRPDYTLAARRIDGSPVCALAAGANYLALRHLLLTWRLQVGPYRLLIVPTHIYAAHVSADRAARVAAQIGA